jgi:4-amino-4-deoxy-L-arabinose transferase-like glycosyltransferase
MQTLPPTTQPSSEAPTSPGAQPGPRFPAARGGARAPLIEGAVVLVLTLFAFAVRWPHLWTVPRFTDETLEVLHSLEVVRDGARPFTNYDSYYGALYNYVVASALWLSGESPFAPRLVVLVAGALTVTCTYLLGRELATRVVDPTAASGDRRFLPIAAGVLAAVLMAINGAHVVVNSHIAWSNCLTPLLTTLAFWLLLRRNLPLAGLTLGVALQTHPLVAALLPGVALYVLVRMPRLLRTPWPYLAAVLFLVGYANVLVYNAQTGWESFRSAQRIQAEYAQDQQASVGYASTAGALLLLLARVVGGAIDQRAGTIEYLLDPFVILACGLAVTSVVWLLRRGEPLPLLVATSFLLLLPALNPKFGTLVTSRYLMPVVPLLLASTAAFLAHAMHAVMAGQLSRAAMQRQRGPVTLGALVIAVLLVVAPLGSLGRYYARAFERSDTNERILRLTREIQTARQADEPVWIDESIGTEMPDTGVTEVRGFEHLLVFARIPYQTMRTTPGRLEDELDDVPSALAVLNARDAAAAAERVMITSLDPRPPATTGRMSDYRLYRIEASGTRRRA